MRIKYKNYERKGTLIDGIRVVDHPLYQVFMNMHRRCENEDDKSYENYGARGISVCDRWDYFVNFVSDMGAKPSHDYSLERVDNNAGYSPDNCVWATGSDQCVNRRTFANNTTGVRGAIRVNKDKGRFQARFDYERVRYNIGRFNTSEEALYARAVFTELFFKDRDAAVNSIQKESTWFNSKSGKRGVTPHVDGGYMARCTIDGKRHYVGYFKTVEEASNARQKYIAKGY